MLLLTIDDGREAEREVLIDRFPARIGRAPDSDLLLGGWRIARLHAEIHRFESGLRLLDQGSLVGTLVNGERVFEYGPLAEGDEIAIGHVRMTVRRIGTHGEARLALDAAGARSGHGIALVAPGSGHEPQGHSTLAPTHEPVFDSANEQAVSPDPGSSNRAPSARSSTASRREQLKRQVHRELLRRIDLRRLDPRQLTDAQLRAEVRVHIDAVLPELVDASLDAERLAAELLDEILGLGPLEGPLADPEVSEIMVNGAQSIFVERAGRLERHDGGFMSDESVRAMVERIVTPLGRRIDEASPMVDARLPDGSRLNAVIAPLATRGCAVTIRKFGRRVFRPEDLVASDTASEAMLAFLRLCVAERCNMLVSGGTGSGKTTLLNVLSNLIDAGERIVTIEDAAELQLAHPHWVALEARPANVEGQGRVSIRDLVRNALRMRPDRIIVGECRGAEALDMLQAMNTGHDGSLTTLHANGPRDVISRLEVMVLMAGVDIPVVAIREQIASAVDIVVHLARGADGRRRIVSIVEVTGVESGRVQLQELFRYEPGSVREGAQVTRGIDGTRGAEGTHALPSGRFTACGIVPSFYETLAARGLALDYGLFSDGAPPHRAVREVRIVPEARA